MEQFFSQTLKTSVFYLAKKLIVCWNKGEIVIPSFICAMIKKINDLRVHETLPVLCLHAPLSVINTIVKLYSNLSGLGNNQY